MCDLVRDCVLHEEKKLLRSYLWERWLSITSYGFLFPFSISHPLLSGEIKLL